MTRLSFSPCAALLFVALVFLFPYSANAGPKRETLRLVEACPTSERLCLRAELSLTPDRRGRLTYRLHGNTFTDTGAITQDIVVSGRLNGGAPRVFLLRSYRPFDDFQNPERDLGFVAFFGRSRGNRPVVLTSHGRLEILTKSVDVSYGAQLMMMDDRTWKVTANFLSRQSLVISSAREIGIWDERAKTCIVAPTEHARGLKFSRTACRGRLKGTSFVLDEIIGDVAPAAIPVAPLQPLFFEIWGQENSEVPNDGAAATYTSFGGGGNGINVYRIGKSHMLILAVDHDPC